MKRLYDKSWFKVKKNNRIVSTLKQAFGKVENKKKIVSISKVVFKKKYQKGYLNTNLLFAK